MGMITGESVSKLLNRLNQFHGRQYKVERSDDGIVSLYHVYDHDKPITFKGHTLVAAYWLLTGILYEVQGRI